MVRGLWLSHCNWRNNLEQELRWDRGYVAGDDEWNDLQVCLSAAGDTAATPTDPDTGKQEQVREKGRGKTNRCSGSFYFPEHCS